MDESVLGIFGLVLGIASLAYAAYEAHQSRVESRKLRNLVNVLARAFEAEGLISVNRDASGEITGIQHALKGEVKVTSQASAASLDEVDRPRDD